LIVVLISSGAVFESFYSVVVEQEQEAKAEADEELEALHPLIVILALWIGLLISPDQKVVIKTDVNHDSHHGYQHRKRHIKIPNNLVKPPVRHGPTLHHLLFLIIFSFSFRSVDARI
jgi:hypothetical protein